MPTLIDAPTSTFVLDEAAKRRIEAIVDQDEPLDNPFSQIQRTLLAESLGSSWTPPFAADRPGERRKFWAGADIGVFASDTDFLAPDNFVALDVEPPMDLEVRAYYLWDHKPPVVAVEVVSNRVGNELGSKLSTYARWGIEYYVVYDPRRTLRGDALYIYVLEGGRYLRTSDHFLPKLGLGVTIWQGVYDNAPGTYLRWCDSSGALILTGKEAAIEAAEMAEGNAEEARRSAEEARRSAEEARRSAEEARRSAEEARRSAEEARRNAEEARRNAEERDQANARAARYLEMLRAQGIDPDAE